MHVSLRGMYVAISMDVPGRKRDGQCGKEVFHLQELSMEGEKAPKGVILLAPDFSCRAGRGVS